MSYTPGNSPATAPFSDNSAPLNGFPVGLQAGCDIVPDGSPLLVGVVTDLFVNGPSGSSPTYPSATPGIFVTSRTSIPVFGTLRARAGITADDTLFYLTGGLAVASVSNNVSTNNLPEGESLSNIHMGWVAGGGLEHRVTENISLFAEYAYYDLGAKSYNYQGAINFGAPVEFHPTFHQIKVGLNYRF